MDKLGKYFLKTAKIKNLMISDLANSAVGFFFANPLSIGIYRDLYSAAALGKIGNGRVPCRVPLPFFCTLPAEYGRVRQSWQSLWIKDL